MTLPGPRWKPLIYVLLTLLSTEVLLLTASAVASEYHLTPVYERTLPEELIVRTERNVPSICNCRKICVTDSMCRAYTSNRHTSDTLDCYFSNTTVTPDQLIDEPFGITYLKAGTPPASTTTPATSSTTTSTTNSSTTSTTTSTTSPTTTLTTTSATASTTASTTTSTATSATTSTTTLSATTPLRTTLSTTTATPVVFFLTVAGSYNGSLSNQEAMCASEGGVPASLTSMEKMNQVIDELGSEFADSPHWVALQYNGGNHIWPDGTLYSDTDVTLLIAVAHASGECYDLNKVWKFYRVFCSGGRFRRVLCEK